MAWYTSSISYLFISILLSIVNIAFEIYITIEKEKLVTENKYKKYMTASMSLFLSTIIILAISFIFFRKDIDTHRKWFNMGFITVITLCVVIVCLWIADTVN